MGAHDLNNIEVKQFDFTGTMKTVLIGFMVLGVVCMGITWFVDDELHTRFWSNLLHNSSFFTGISFMATFFISVCITAWAGWYTLFKRVWEAFSMFIFVGIVLMIIVALSVFFHWNHLYHWTDTSILVEGSENFDSILAGKSSFLNKYWYLLATIIILGIWAFFAYKLRSISLSEDDNGSKTDFAHQLEARKWAAAFLPIAGFSSCAVIWQWIMSVDSHWYSTLYAWYCGASWFVSMIALTLLVMLFLKAKGYLHYVTENHLHDLGKFLFAFSVFWTYLWFSQFLLIWYGNVGEETVYFKMRYDHYPVLFFGNVLINFFVPFFVLMRNDTKRKVGTLALAAGVVLFGHWVDTFQMLKPGIYHTAQEHLSHAGHGDAHGTHDAAHHAAEHGHEAVSHAVEHASSFVSGFTLPGLLEVGTFLGFLGLFLFVVFTVLSRTNIYPKNDVYLDESLSHHVI